MQIEINTIEDIEKSFPNEESVRKYLANLRWGQWAKCPKCGNHKAYFIDNGTRYKCANNKCYNKFSVISNTIMTCSNLPLIVWIKSVFYYVKKRGRVNPFELSLISGVTDRTGILIQTRIDFAWEYVDRNKTGTDLINDLFMKMFSLYELYQQSEKTQWKTSYHISNIDNINDPYQFQILLNYAKVRLYFCQYIYINFASPGEIMTEVFLYLHDNKIKDYDATYIVKIINRTIAKMWYQYHKEHPNLMIRLRKYYKEYRRQEIRNLKKRYLVQLAMSDKNYSEISRGELRQSVEILNKIKERVKIKRDKRGVLYEFESHFN